MRQQEDDQFCHHRLVANPSVGKSRQEEAAASSESSAGYVCNRRGWHERHRLQCLAASFCEGGRRFSYARLPVRWRCVTEYRVSAAW